MHTATFSRSCRSPQEQFWLLKIPILLAFSPKHPELGLPSQLQEMHTTKRHKSLRILILHFAFFILHSRKTCIQRTLIFTGTLPFHPLPLSSIPQPQPFAAFAVPAILSGVMLQPYDFLMLAVLLGAVLFGVWKGVAWQVASLASVLVSAAVAVHSSAALAPYFGAQEPWNRFFAMAVLYVITAAAIWLLFRLVAGVIDRVQLKEFDRQLGAIFGLAKGVLYCVIITFFAVTLSEPARQAVLESKSGPLIARVIRDANPVLPDDVRTWLGKYIEEFNAKFNTPPQELPKESAVPQDLVTPKSSQSRGADAKSINAEKPTKPMP
jgi:membrane protein required for colicin V production